MSGDAALSLPPEKIPEKTEKTLFFPVSGNPIGFNHFAAAEGLLRANAAWDRVVFVLSNGIHPDPTKADAEAGRGVRLEMLTAAIAELGNTERSHLARLAKRAGETLRAGPETLLAWTREFAFPHAVRTAETVLALREAHSDSDAPIFWFAGSDLVARMAEPEIFPDDDLEPLARHCHYAILERDGQPLEPALERLASERGVRLRHTAFHPAGMPSWLTPFLELSSTRIRYAAEAGDPLGAMLPDGVAELIAGEGLYRGAPPGVLSPWRGELDGLQRELERAAGKLSERLTHNQAAGKAHSFSLVEASVGGLLTHAFGGRSGASVFFRQARFAYDLHAKETLIGGGLEGRSAVSDEGAVALAQGMRAQGATDFALAETGMAGPPDGRRRSFKNGLCHIALVTPKAVHTERIQLNPFATRREHQYRFAIHALNKTSQWLDQDGF